jgi:hypothetical protein
MSVTTDLEDELLDLADRHRELELLLLDYCVEHYGQCPVYFNPMQCNFGAVVHHVDPAFYDRCYDGSTVTPAIRRHMQEWHS